MADLTEEQLVGLESHATEARRGVCALEADEVLELVRGYRAMRAEARQHDLAEFKEAGIASANFRLQHGLDDPCACGHIRGDHRPTEAALGTVLNQRHEPVLVSSGVVCGGPCGRVDCFCSRYTRKG